VNTSALRARYERNTRDTRRNVERLKSSKVRAIGSQVSRANPRDTSVPRVPLVRGTEISSLVSRIAPTKFRRDDDLARTIHARRVSFRRRRSRAVSSKPRLPSSRVRSTSSAVALLALSILVVPKPRKQQAANRAKPTYACRGYRTMRQFRDKPF